MKKQFLILFLGLISFVGYSQALSSDQKSDLITGSALQNRIGEVLREKALYWKNFAVTNTPNRADVNRQFQKRMRLSKLILSSTWSDANKNLVAAYWVIQYAADPAVVDGNGVPTTAAISATFDSTYDYFAGYITGDENLTQIDW